MQVQIRLLHDGWQAVNKSVRKVYYRGMIRVL